MSRSRRQTLFVSGFPGDIRASELGKAFERCGRLIRCDIPRPRTGERPFFAFVEFESSRDAEYAYDKMEGYEIDRGYRLRVDWARNQKPLRSPSPPPHRRSSRRSPSPRRHSRSSRRSRTPPRRRSRSRSRSPVRSSSRRDERSSRRRTPSPAPASVAASPNDSHPTPSADTQEHPIKNEIKNETSSTATDPQVPPTSEEQNQSQETKSQLNDDEATKPVSVTNEESQSVNEKANEEEVQKSEGNDVSSDHNEKNPNPSSMDIVDSGRPSSPAGIIVEEKGAAPMDGVEVQGKGNAIDKSEKVESSGDMEKSKVEAGEISHTENIDNSKVEERIDSGRASMEAPDLPVV